MARNLTLVATATAMFFSLSGPTKCHGSRCPNVPGLACLRERLDGGLTTSVPYHGPGNAEFHVRLAEDVVTGAVVSGTFRCRTLPTPFGNSASVCTKPTGTLTNIVLRPRSDRSNLRDFGLDDFDADLSFAGVSESCHIAATAVHVGRPFTSVTGGYTCTDAAGAVFDVGIVVLRSKCK